MSLFVVSPAAQDDLINIYLYTDRTWGDSQAEKYLSQIEQQFLNLAKCPELGQDRFELYPGAKSFPQGKHVIFYRLVSEAIEIVRVLHTSMNTRKHF